MPTKISPMTTYYVRRLYRQKDPYLSQVEDMGDDFSTCLDLEQVLKSLYNEGELNLMARQLETLVQYHQGLTAQGHASGPQLKEVEQRIFAILGESPSAAAQASGTRSPSPSSSTSPDQPSITVKQLLRILNQLQEAGTTYLGTAITANYLQSARPDQDWFEQFQVQRSQPVTFTGDLSQALDAPQRDLSQKWVKRFVQSCTQVIAKFPNIVNLDGLLSQF